MERTHKPRWVHIPEISSSTLEPVLKRIMPSSPEKHAKYMREVWYPKNKDRHKKLVTNNNRRRSAETYKFLRLYKESRGCSTCPEADSRCLDFHHTDRQTKKFTISAGVARGLGKRALLREIEKCIILCTNCHRKVTFKKWEN